MRVATLVLTLVCTPAFAQTPQPEQKAPENQQPSAAAGASGKLFSYDDAEAQRLFRQFDTNGDGYLSPDEIASQQSNQGNWAAVDRNGDGRISPSEFTVIRPR